MLRTAPRSFALAVTMSVLVGLLPAASTLAGPAAARPVSQAPAAAPPAPWRESAPRPVPASRAGTGLPQRVVAGAGGGPRISISVPERVVVGQPITIVVAARGLRDLAGFEAVLTFDTKAAEFDGVQQRQVALKGSGRAVTPLGAVELDQGVAFGLVSCPFSDCLARTRRAATGVRGDTELARISVIPRVAGTLEFGLGAAKSVDATGAPTSLALPSQMARVTVGASAGGSVHRAGGAPWRLGSTAAGTGTPGVPANLRKRDIAGARSVGFVDLAEAGRAWRAVREDGDPCSAAGAPADIDRDGCVDVTDVQLVARDLASTTVTTAELSSTRDLASTTVTTAELSSTRAVESDATSDVTLASSSSPLVLVVTSTGDQAEAAADQGDGVCLASSGCTLRAAITEANLHRGPDTIEFAIGGSGVRTITLGSSLPTVADESGGVTINGFSQPGSAANRHARASNADIRIQIVGAPTPAAFHGLMITSPSNVVRGLSFFNLKRGIVVSGFAAHHNTLAGLLVGTNAGPATVNGTSYAAFKFQSPLLSNAHGIAIELGAAYNTVGGRELADRNVVSGNGNSGIATFDEGTDHTLIVNNIAGLEPDGQLPRRNAIHGIDVNFNSSYSIIGGLGPNDRNVVSANESDAIELSHGSLTVGNRIIGNWVGTTADGLLAPRYLANQHTGINVEDGATNTLVWKNVVVNNGWAGPGYGGIAVDGWYAWGNTVVENFVGITPGGLTAANANFGVGLLNKAAFNTVGPGNVVTASPVGVWADGEDTDANTITGNTIHGTTSLGIDLAPAGVTVNDPGDADTGPNDRRNSPVLVSATANEVRGSACGGCTVDVYLAEPVATDRGSGGYGPGRTMVGSTRAAADGAFAASISGVAPNAILTATATDSSGNTSEFAYNLVPAGTTLATDRFTRRVSDAWGVADVGGAWATSGTAADFDVDGDAATALSPAAGTGRSATLAIVTPQDADQTLRVKASSLVGSHVYVVARRSSGAVLSEYRARLRLTSTGQAWLRASRVVANGSEVGIGTEAQVAGVTVAPGSYVRLRFQAVGTAPTTLRLKAWSDGAPEPSAWGLVVTDAAAQNQKIR